MIIEVKHIPYSLCKQLNWSQISEFQGYARSHFGVYSKQHVLL